MPGIKNQWSQNDFEFSAWIRWALRTVTLLQSDYAWSRTLQWSHDQIDVQWLHGDIKYASANARCYSRLLDCLSAQVLTCTLNTEFGENGSTADLQLCFRSAVILERYHFRAKTLFWNLNGYLQTVFFLSECLSTSKIKCFSIFLETLYHFKVPKKVKIGEKWPKFYRF